MIVGKVKGLSPYYFALVMATGIVSIASLLWGMRVIAVTLLMINIIFYVALSSLTFLRIVKYNRQFLNDLTSHQNGPGVFTLVAGTCILGNQFILIWGKYTIAIFLWYVGIALWLCFIYTIFTALTIKENKPTLAEGITGGWLTSVVATQSVAVLTALISPHIEQPLRLYMNFFALSLWLLGGMLYIWMISLIFYRYTFFKFSPADLTPPYWINMGAMAISTLAGALLIKNTNDAPFLQSLLPFLKGFTVFFWVTGTWWIPMLVILAVWRHFYKRFPLKYDPLYWGAVFPLGMYTVSTFQLGSDLALPFLIQISRVFAFISLIAWGITFTGLIHNVFETILQTKQECEK